MLIICAEAFDGTHCVIVSLKLLVKWRRNCSSKNFPLWSIFSCSDLELDDTTKRVKYVLQHLMAIILWKFHSNPSRNVGGVAFTRSGCKISCFVLEGNKSLPQIVSLAYAVNIINMFLAFIIPLWRTCQYCF